MDSVMMCSGNN